MTMKVSPLPEDADALIAFAEAIATVLSEKKEELGVSTELEGLLRASIASATVAVSSYLFVIACAKKSAVTQGYMAFAKARCNQTLQKLRRRLTRTIAQLSRLIEEKALSEISI
jgi:hypothetical protein